MTRAWAPASRGAVPAGGVRRAERPGDAARPAASSAGRTHAPSGAAALCGALLAGCAGGAAPERPAGALPPTAAGYPRGALTLLAPASPGGGWDQTARQLQQVWTEAGILGVPVEVVNRGGAGGAVGLADFVARGDPHTLMVFGQVMLGAIRTNRSPVSIDAAAPLARLLDEYEVIAVPAGSPHETLADLLRAFRAEPERVSWAGGSAGGIDHMLAGLLARAAGVDPTRVNYVAHSGGGEAAVAVMGGHVTAGISGFGEWKAHAEGGRMRLLAVSSPERIAGSDTPTLRESGFDVVIANWRGIMAAPGADDETRAWLIEALAALRASNAWQDILRRNDWEDSFLAGAGFERFLQEETANVDEILRSIGLAAPAGGDSAP